MAAGAGGAADTGDAGAGGWEATTCAGGVLELAVPLVEIAVNATATAVTDRPPNIQGSKSRSLFIG
jgi:hypothetical protein